MKVIVLPATDPADTRYGRIDHDGLAVAFPSASFHCIHFDRMVWYTEEVRAEAYRQIDAILSVASNAPVCLVGFSKSGVGAFNLVLDHPSVFAHVVIFDAPLTNRDRSKYGMTAFYASDEALAADDPLARLEQGSVVGSTSFILVSGEAFADQMGKAANSLRGLNVPHRWLRGGDLYAHRWDSGWLENSLKAICS